MEIPYTGENHRKLCLQFLDILRIGGVYEGGSICDADSFITLSIYTRTFNAKHEITEQSFSF